MFEEMRMSVATLGQVEVPLFENAFTRGKFAKAWAALTKHENRLLDLATFTQGKTIVSQRSAGLRTIDIFKIQGSESRSDTFDRSFNPLHKCSKQRWMSVAKAVRRGYYMPAIELIKIGDIYFVRDGHHRISVSKAMGRTYVDAHVTVWEVQ